MLKLTCLQQTIRAMLKLTFLTTTHYIDEVTNFLITTHSSHAVTAFPTTTGMPKPNFLTTVLSKPVTTSRLHHVHIYPALLHS